MIISGSPVIGNFDFGSGVDYIRIPGVTKLPGRRLPQPQPERLDRRGGRAAPGPHPAGRRDLPARRADRRQGADRLPRRGPATLEHLRRGCRLVLGIRDVMDEPALSPRMGAQGAKDALRDATTRSGSTASRTSTSPSQPSRSPRGRAADHLYGYLRRDVPQVTPGRRSPQDHPAAVHPRDHRRRRRRRRRSSTGSFRPTRPTRARPVGADRVRSVHQRRPPPRVHGSHRQASQARRADLRYQDRAPDREGRGRRRDGRLQHLLRDPVLRQARPHRAAHAPAPRATSAPSRRSVSVSSAC